MRAWAQIDLGAYRENLARLRRAVGPAVGVMAVVKADAYGHGAVRIAAEALDAGCSMVGVGDLSEAIELRDRGVTGPILLMGALLPGDEEEALARGVQVTIQSRSDLARAAQAARRLGIRAAVHLKVDTGMHRLGATPGEAVMLAAAPEVAGIFTHFSSTTLLDDNFTASQLAVFRMVLDRATARPRIVHAANSAAAFRYPAARFDMVRSGGALYGIDPGALRSSGVSLTPVLSLRTRVASVRTIEPGESVGYNQRWRAARRTRLALLPIGYHDGYPHRLSNRGRVLIGGREAPVVGAVTMDYTIVDVTDLPPVDEGATATLFGRDGEAELRVEDLARQIGTVPYEITSRLGRRVRRVVVRAAGEAAA
ncbi:MAG: alanine racemase [Candidatus Handelsmanbacteria bacterium RIFCSPLOWO2_12_FULL_64_10]|uniref:Alanine racemase n=1 Tax=Handelsmanbacteria sp. (strain RIFCSPLOWO2_12_FULL_64_10) TaxID=1817868 RepID=A0A1F6D1E0_HANXR|nr:MAG: alanine racemase [Candidatus Handelsmanbacteria bacterium RIFCSPLOWO2_12_FULL_64_10]